MRLDQPLARADEPPFAYLDVIGHCSSWWGWRQIFLIATWETRRPCTRSTSRAISREDTPARHRGRIVCCKAACCWGTDTRCASFPSPSTRSPNGAAPPNVAALGPLCHTAIRHPVADPIPLELADQGEHPEQHLRDAIVGNRVDAHIRDHQLNALVFPDLRAGEPVGGPTKGAVEPSPRWAIVTAPQYEALLERADEVHRLFRLALVPVHETRHRVGVDIASPGDPSQPVSRHLVRDWWERGEQLAGLAREPGRGWHSLRRQFATELKGMPLADLAALGGWRSPATILACYQQPDPITMREGLARRGRLEMRGA